MNTNTNTNTITIDKLHYSFNSDITLNIEDIIRIFEYNGYQIGDPKTKINNDYKIQKEILINNIQLGTLHLNSRFSPTLNTIKFYNKTLYTNKELVNNLVNLIITHFPDDNNISRLEIALDTNINLIKRYNSLIKNERLIFHPNYLGDYYSTEYRYNKFNRDDNRETKYIIHKKSTFNNDTIKGTNPHLRIENKKILLDTSTDRKYIKDYLEQSGININKDYYRIEITIPNKELFNISSYPVYITDNDKISKYEYDKLDQFTQSNYHKRTERNIENIEVNELLYNRDYLYSLFYQKSKKIIYNIDKIINQKFNNTTMKTKTKLTNTRSKSIQEKDVRPDSITYWLGRGVELGFITENVVRNVLKGMEKENERINNNNELYEDIFN